MDISLSTLLLAIPIGYAFLWITVPLSTLFHELGHVLTAFFWSNDKIYVKIGMKENGRLFRVGRLQFNISLSIFSLFIYIFLLFFIISSYNFTYKVIGCKSRLMARLC